MKRIERRQRECIHLCESGERCKEPTQEGRPNGWLCAEHDAKVNSEEEQRYQALPYWKKLQVQKLATTVQAVRSAR